MATIHIILSSGRVVWQPDGWLEAKQKGGKVEAGALSSLPDGGYPLAVPYAATLALPNAPLCDATKAE